MPIRRTPYPDWINAERSKFGHRIAVLREQAGLSQDQLADRMGVERRTIQRYEAATRDPRYRDLLLLAAGLGVPPAALFGEQPAAGTG
ncbi:helix-turn-helix transcriptional regulator [Streptomyces antibioticus]|uniref:helix-turn-helix transcriptional regulator n=1 Tax=Streptomyces antibioticus TaxID=1890 RepID=UPI0033F0937E